MFSLKFKIAIFLCVQFIALSYSNEFVIKSGFIIQEAKYGVLDDDNRRNEDDTKGYGAHTSYSYKWDRIESGLESRITLGKAVDLRFQFQDEAISGRGRVRHVDISPFIKYHSPTFFVPKLVQNVFSSINISPWYAYIKVGPSWLLQTINLDGFDVKEEFRDDLKLTYESFGFNVSIGIEEATPYKDMHPVFIELAGSIYESYKVSVVDKSEPREINILGSKEADQDIKTFSLMLIIGMALF